MNSEQIVNTAKNPPHIVKTSVEFYYILLYDKMSYLLRGSRNRRYFHGREACFLFFLMLLKCNIHVLPRIKFDRRYLSDKKNEYLKKYRGG